MKKIPSLYAREYTGDRLIRDEVVPGSAWVLAGEGTPTRKWDGTSCLVQDGVRFKRYDCRNHANPPRSFIPAQEPDSGHWPGWLPVSETAPGDRWHREAWAVQFGLPDGTYELIGPKVQGGVEREFPEHVLVRHGAAPLSGVPRTFAGLRAYLLDRPEMEGIVWHHPDGRMCKLKKRLHRCHPREKASTPERPHSLIHKRLNISTIDGTHLRTNAFSEARA